MMEFLSTPSARRATMQLPAWEEFHHISIHALREEGDPPLPTGQGGLLLFLSTPSARRATGATLLAFLNVCNFYPRPPRGGRHFALLSLCGHIRISIHALREEGDKCRRSPTRRWRYFYPRPPRGGRLIGIRGPVLRQDFYPRPPRGGRPLQAAAPEAIQPFLSTPSARRATARSLARTARTINFYPRPPRGGRPSPPPTL